MRNEEVCRLAWSHSQKISPRLTVIFTVTSSLFVNIENRYGEFMICSEMRLIVIVGFHKDSWLDNVKLMDFLSGVDIG